MKLEEAIKQSSFKNEYAKLVVNLLYTYGWLNSSNVGRLKKFQISPQQYNILRILRGQHPVPATVNLLAERMLDRMSNASRLVEKLRAKALVKRTECEKDRRRVDVSITEKGLNLLNQIESEENQWLRKFESLSSDEAKMLNNLLDKLRC